MQRVTKKNLQVGIPMLAAAAAGVCIGVPTAHADFVLTWRTSLTSSAGAPLSTPTPVISNTTITNPALNGGNGGSEQVNVFTLQALNNGLNNTGSTLTVFDAAVFTPGSYTDQTQAIFIDINADINGSGLPSADVIGAADTDFGTPQPSFASSIGTFMGVATAAGFGANGTKPPKAVYVNNGSGGNYSSPAPYINDQVQDVGNETTNTAVTTGTGVTNPSTGTVNAIAPFVDPNFLNETVHALEIAAAFAGGAPTANVAPVQFVNLVLPTAVGTNFNIIGIIGGETSAPNQNFQYIGIPTSTTVVTGPTLSLGSAKFPVVATLAVTGSNGNYVPNVATVSPGATQGSVVIDPFSPSTDPEIFALEVLEGGSVPNGTDLATIAAQLQAALQTEFSNATVGLTDPSPNAAFKASSFFDIFVDIPTPGANGNSDLNFDLSEISGLTGSGALTVNAIGVVPEPTGVGVLALGCVGLLARRRRMSQVA
jgi:hypothetical protein